MVESNKERKRLDINYLIDASEALEKDLKTPLGIGIHENKTRPEDFKILKNIAKGGYGEVYVVEKDNKIYAMKKVPKELVLKNPNTTFFMNEKEIMTTHSADWLVRSYVCVQDSAYIYYIMDFIPGGDLLGYLSKIDIMKENEIRFYATEIFLAVNEIHELGWIHRDLKPDNILIDAQGHVKIADFGSCAKLTNGFVKSSTTVGTPDYVSPDVLSSIGDCVIYGPEVDFWTVGVILYEMFYGVTPFYSESLRKTYDRISSIEYSFDDGISEELKDLIKNLLCLKEKRYGIREVKVHVFFKGTDWNTIRSQEAPFKPKIEGEGDISNFVDTEFEPDDTAPDSGFTNFIGFTHDPEHCKRIAEMFVLGLERERCMSKSIMGNELEEKCKIREIEDESLNRIPKVSLITDDVSSGMKQVSLKVVGDISAKGVSDMADTRCVCDISNMIGTSGIRDTADLAGTSSINDRNITSDSIQMNNRLTLEIELKKNELDSLNKELTKVSEKYNSDLLERMALIDKCNLDIKGLAKEIKQKREELSDIRSFLSQNAIQPDKTSLPVIDEKTLASFRSLKDSIEAFNFNEKLCKIQHDANLLYGLNTQLIEEIKNSARCLTVSSNKTNEDLKKQLRMHRTEIREYEQRIEQEIVARKKLEEEIKKMKKSLKESSRMMLDFTIQVTNAISSKETFLVFENNTFRLNDQEVFSNSVYIRDLRNNEMHHLSYKKRALCVQIHFLGDEICSSSSSGTRRSYKALESDMEKEMKIIKGLDDLLKVLSGKTREEAEMQMKGSLRKIEQLKAEMERVKKSTITENLIDDDEKVNEFNNHLFYEKTVAKGILCDHCNEVLYGVVNQAFVCRDCLLVVHKSCYVLVEESCELNRAMKSGTTVPVICKTKEDKEKLLKLNRSLF